jgi:hypothetical protein
MPVTLEVSIERLIGDPARLQEQPECYPEAPAVYVVFVDLVVKGYGFTEQQHN